MECLTHHPCGMTDAEYFNISYLIFKVCTLCIKVAPCVSCPSQLFFVSIVYSKGILYSIFSVCGDFFLCVYISFLLISFPLFFKCLLCFVLVFCFALFQIFDLYMVPFSFFLVPSIFSPSASPCTLPSMSL